MISLRSLARATPRAFARSSSQVSNRTFASLRRPTQAQHAWKTIAVPQRAGFSTALRAFQAEKAGSVDEELSAKFAEELQLEKEHSAYGDELPSHLKEFLETRDFKCEDIAGDQEVVLTKTFGNEKITVSFSIADLNETEHEPDLYSQDRAMYDADESLEAQSGGAQSKNTINQGKTKGGNFNVAPEDSVAPADREELMDDESPDAEPAFPVNLNIIIEKEGLPSALSFQALAHDGSITIGNVFNYAKKEFADAKTAELDWSRRNVYTGPPYGNLDESLQILLENYLEERGVDTALAVFVPEYIDFKEQREYMAWLENTKSFVEA